MHLHRPLQLAYNRYDFPVPHLLSLGCVNPFLITSRWCRLCVLASMLAYPNPFTKGHPVTRVDGPLELHLLHALGSRSKCIRVVSADGGGRGLWPRPVHFLVRLVE
jgi:hypothetical protein